MTQKIVAFKPFNDQLIFFNPYSNKFEEVPGGAPHGRGFTINEVFHRVHEGQDITELVECVHEVLLEKAKARAQFSRSPQEFPRERPARSAILKHESELTAKNNRGKTAAIASFDQHEDQKGDQNEGSKCCASGGDPSDPSPNAISAHRRFK